MPADDSALLIAWSHRALRAAFLAQPPHVRDVTRARVIRLLRREAQQARARRSALWHLAEFVYAVRVDELQGDGRRGR
jgi:hypothetical protein